MLAGWIMNSAMKNNTICAHENDTLLSLHIHPPKIYFLCLLIMTMPLSNLFALCLPCIHICTSKYHPLVLVSKTHICFPVMRKTTFNNAAGKSIPYFTALHLLQKKHSTKHQWTVSVIHKSICFSSCIFDFDLSRTL